MSRSSNTPATPVSNPASAQGVEAPVLSRNDVCRLWQRVALERPNITVEGFTGLLLNEIDDRPPSRDAAVPASGGVEAGYLERVAAACAVLFDGDPTDVEERRDRFAEEANELCQALGMSREDAHALVDYTYGRPVGDPAKEAGAVMTTLAALASEAGFDLMACAEADLANLTRPETIARIRAKRATRHGRGPLPGLSPAPTSGSKVVCAVIPPPETYGGSPNEPWTGKLPTSGSEAGGEVGEQCESCQGNGEIVTDWGRYLHAEPEDKGDEGTAECPDCNGAGRVGAKPASEPAGGGVREAVKPLANAVTMADDWNKLHPNEKRASKDFILDSELRDLAAALSAPATPSPAEAEALPAGVEVERIIKIIDRYADEQDASRLRTRMPHVGEMASIKTTAAGQIKELIRAQALSASAPAPEELT